MRPFPASRSLAAFFAAALLAACGTMVERIDPGETKDLSGAWNDTDSRLVSEEMIQDVLARTWLDGYSREYKKPPAVIVGEVRNLSHEHINVVTFVADMERALINSGRVKFVASRTERMPVREERKDQELHAREDTRKPMGKEVGADYLLGGTINTIIDVEGRQQVRYYQVDLTLISLADNTKVWVGQKKIKKFVTGSKLRF